MRNPHKKVLMDEVSGIEVKNDAYYIWEEGYKAGIREAVEWISKTGTCPECGMGIETKKWQSKLKEWGIK